MDNRRPSVIVMFGCLLAVAAATPTVELELEAPPDGANISTYIVHVANSHAPRSTLSAARLTSVYTSFLRDALPPHISEPAPSILYAYAHAMTGFAARLTERQAAHLETQPSVLRVTPDKLYELQTTLSPTFLGLTPSSPLMAASNGATDVVIAVLDTGIYPKDRASFYPSVNLPPPARFRGGCVSTPNFDAAAYCNSKLVGAKFFTKGSTAWCSEASPLDVNGHGTHCASIAAGSPVPNANLFGYATGTAQGAAPGARIASYKVCTGCAAKSTCPSSDVLAGLNEAIADKVDVISLSLGGQHPNLYDDLTAVGAFSAVREGIPVIAAGGNSGPDRATLYNVAPWFLTVGASNMNREFRAPVKLGNGKTFRGVSLYDVNSDPSYDGTKMKPLVYGLDVGSDGCMAGKLDPIKVAGKIVVCSPGVNLDTEKGAAVKQAGGVGAIIASGVNYGEYVKAEAHVLPAVSVTFADAIEIAKYSQTPNPVATISSFSSFTGQLSLSPPRVAAFSSRGPNHLAPEILKPDVVAPGVEILAAWTGERAPSQVVTDTRRVKFNVLSGTSMACPHVSGIAAMLKAARSAWSPAAIKSALMTTAYNMDRSGGAIKDTNTSMEAGPFDLGAGHVDPNSALDPGLVFDAGEDDYISFLCALGYTPRQIAIFTKASPVVDVCSKHKGASVGDLNYPAFSVAFKSYTDKVTQRRVVRNVGSNVNAVYTISRRGPVGNVGVTVTPDRLVFDAQHQTREYTVTFSTLNPSVKSTEEHGALVWSDGKHEVASPMVFTWPAPKPGPKPAVAAM